MKRLLSLAAGMSALCCLGLGQATPPAPTLHIGDPAPPLAVGKWLKGAPIGQYLSNQEYLIVFWSTWCPEFLSVSKHLNEILAQYGGGQLTVVAVSVFEPNQGKVGAYVEHLANQMDFEVADDDVPPDSKHGLDGKMATSWLAASSQTGLPIAFIVDHSGKIAWIGSPVGTLMDDPIRKVMDNTWDSASYAAKFNSQQEKDKAVNDIETQMAAAINNGDYDGALKLSDELTPYNKGAAVGARYLTMLRKADYDVTKSGKGDFDAAYTFCKQSAEGPFSKDFNAIFALAWITVNPTAHWSKPDTDLGVELAKQAVELSYHRNAAPLDLLAWAYYEKKDKDQAVSTEKEALSVAQEDEKARLAQSLRTFQSGG